MFTLNEAPWVQYLEIDEETGERKLRADTPEEIRQKYEDYCNNLKNTANEMRPK